MGYFRLLRTRCHNLAGFIFDGFSGAGITIIITPILGEYHAEVRNRTHSGYGD